MGAGSISESINLTSEVLGEGEFECDQSIELEHQLFARLGCGVKVARNSVHAGSYCLLSSFFKYSSKSYSKRSNMTDTTRDIRTQFCETGIQGIGIDHHSARKGL